MYELKTLLPKMEIQLPTSMYTVRNYGLSHEKKENQVKDEKCRDISVRQDTLLNQLQDLKKKLADIRVSLSMPDMPQSNLIGKGNQLREEQFYDIVINAHPNYVPYALLAMKNAWKNMFILQVKAYAHSSITKISKEAENFQKNVEEIISADLPTLNITLIWKNCEHTEMISSPTMYVPIYGEVNIVRFLGRVGPPEYRYENSSLCNEIDAVLDICYQLLRCSTSKARSQLVRALNNYLQQNQYFGGDFMSVADIAVRSTLKRLPQMSTKDLTIELNGWLKRVEVVTLI